MNRQHRIGMALVAAFSLLVASSSLGGEPKSGPFLPDLPENWTEITPGPTNYMGMDLAPTCSGAPGTDPEFSFFAKGGTVNNLVVYFQGGGACWDAATCLYLKPYTQEVNTTVATLENAGGMLDTNDPENPFKDWSFVFVPYCTGDIHWGSNDIEYSLPPVIPPTVIHHRGFDNFLVVLKWITENFQRPHEIFSTGSSAGSYGAITGFPWLQEAYPQSKGSVLGDAGVGVSHPAFQAYTRGNWNAQLPEWIFGEDTLGITMPEIYRMIAEYYPHRKVAEYTNAWDSTQIYFYSLILQTVGVPPEVDACVDWNALMLEGMDEAAEAPNFRSYVAAGTDHTIMGSSRFYTEDSAGVPFLDWVEAMVRNQGGTNGHGGVPWENLECTECDPLPFCPF